MSETTTKLDFEQRQRELQAGCRHPAGNYQPVDWVNPEQSVPHRIEALASSRPRQVAVYDHRTALTYAELDRASNRIANAILGERGAGQEVVALLVGVDVPAVTAALGVLKAGKIYVALETSFPQKRNLEILVDTEAKLLLADERHLPAARELAGSQRGVIEIEALGTGDPSPPGVRVPLESRALLNYTSGSTSQPKAVVQSHRSLFVQAVRYASYYRLSDADQAVFGGSLAWAASFWVVFGPLCLGSTTAPFEFGEHGVDQLVAWLRKTEPSFVGGRSLLRQIATHHPDQRFPSVRAVSMGGDTLYREDIEACLHNFPNALITCGYGLSEAGRATQLAFDSPDMLAWDTLPLGFPEPGVQIKILSDDGREAEPGEAGEIVISDRGLAAGYWRRPEETAARFHAASTPDALPAYYTGDLGRQTEDGLLHHLGRKDFMVKIRGYQVFTNEIEGMLHQVQGVQEVCVAAHALPGGERRLVAYLVVDPQRFPGAAILQARFRDFPRHMVPQSFVTLDALPKTPTGKVDRSRLPVPERSRLNVTAEYAGARDPIERALAQIWGGVLGVDGVGIHDNFLELGGDSLDSMRIINRVGSRLGVRIPLSKFFDVVTVAEMASLVRDAWRSPEDETPGAGKGDDGPRF
jgi:amino acid adenylation domain-containing protein